MICVLAGGVGAARFLLGLLDVQEARDVAVIGNVGDDLVLHGLHVSPDLDTVTYTLAGAIDPERGWGLAGESWAAMGALDRYGDGGWFRLGDRDLATHLHRTQRLADGLPLSAVTAEITAAWGLEVRLVPVTDDPLRTRIVLAEGAEISFQDYFVRRQHAVPVAEIRFEGAGEAHPAPGVLDAIAAAEVVIVAPSNPLVSIDPIVAVPGVRAALEARRASVVAISPIVGGSALKGPADRMLRELGHDASALGVARHHAAIAGTLVIDSVDAELADAIGALEVRPVVTDTVMADSTVRAALARTALEAVR